MLQVDSDAAFAENAREFSLCGRVVGREQRVTFRDEMKLRIVARQPLPSRKREFDATGAATNYHDSQPSAGGLLQDATPTGQELLDRLDGERVLARTRNVRRARRGADVYRQPVEFH